MPFCFDCGDELKDTGKLLSCNSCGWSSDSIHKIDNSVKPKSCPDFGKVGRTIRLRGMSLIIILMLTTILPGCIEEIDESEPDYRDGITITKNGFNPSTLEVPTGYGLSFRNHDDVMHTVTAEDGSFDFELDYGATAGKSFWETGTFNYYCKEHPSMTGVLIVYQN